MMWTVFSAPLLASLLAAPPIDSDRSAWDDPPGDFVAQQDPPPGPPPEGDRPRPPGPPGRGPRRGPGRPDFAPNGPPPPPRPEDRLFRDGEYWVLEASAIRIKANGEEKPFDPAGPITLKLADGREIEILPSRMPPPPPGPPHDGPEGRRRPPGGPGLDGRPPGGFGGPPPHGRRDRPGHGNHDDDDDDDRLGIEVEINTDVSRRAHHDDDDDRRPGPPHGPPGPRHPMEHLLGESFRPLPPELLFGDLGKQEGELHHEIEKLKGKWSEGPADAQAKTKDAILSLIDRQFELRQQIRKRVLERLKGDASRLEGSINKRQENKKTLIDRRMNEILGDGGDEF